MGIRQTHAAEVGGGGHAEVAFRRVAQPERAARDAAWAVRGDQRAPSQRETALAGSAGAGLQP